MTALFILALTLHPAAAKSVPSNRVVYSCPAGEELYIRVRGGAEFLETLGQHDLTGTGIVTIGRDAYYPVDSQAPQRDDRHYCISK